MHEAYCFRQNFVIWLLLFNFMEIYTNIIAQLWQLTNKMTAYYIYNNLPNFTEMKMETETEILKLRLVFVLFLFTKTNNFISDWLNK